MPEFTEAYCQSLASYLDQDLAEDFADFMKVSHETITVAGVKALDYTYTCIILGDTLTSRQIQLAVKGVVYTITFQAEKGKFDEVNLRYFQQMIDSFQVY